MVTAAALVAHPINLSENARTILTKRYLQGDETAEVRFATVAQTIAWAEAPADQERWAQTFYDMLASLEFLPNSPTIRNAGRIGCLSACFVVPIPDSWEGMCEARRQAGLIIKSGGGVGFDFSELRPAGALINSTNRGACGPIKFMQDMSALSDLLTQGGGSFRVGAQMHILRIDHPDIRQFIHCKDDGTTLTHANISIAVTDEFMAALAADEPFNLRFNGVVYEQTSARDLWQEIAESAHKTGDPGIWFIDRSNGAANPLAHLTRIAATNPCGEVPLEPYGSCNLGSINLSKFVEGSGFNLDRLGECVANAVRFLDDVVEVNEMPTPETAAANALSRRIGLGVMGWADALVALRIPYSSHQARVLAHQTMAYINACARHASVGLGNDRGGFPGRDERSQNFRNSFRLCIAPTGTISIIADCSSGIEPIYALAWERTTEDGTVLKEYHPEYQAEPADYLETAHDIAPEAHIAMQAAFQRYVDNAISKTVNLPEHASVADIKRIYQQAYDSDCKGVTVYRNNCRSVQVLNTTPEYAEPAPICPECGTLCTVEDRCLKCLHCGYSECAAA